MPKYLYIKKSIFTLFLLTTYLCYSTNTYGQLQPKVVKQYFNSPSSFIENIDQYGKTYRGYENMDTILLGFEGFGMPILFTKKGLIHLQRKVVSISHKEKEKLEKQGSCRCWSI